MILKGDPVNFKKINLDERNLVCSSKGGGCSRPLLENHLIVGIF
ncbi:predicted protein [Sclerotinia sclerotiorum 1980 UF-70]|uniref:Uncharacterized protein n=1 Tax=Sclerotinia sclerotiorum (strain ATCC 18683 / 1980 / Ss-1) TaxID=665079 RepID=A7F177_SCLS1|nr:predicted protein [Sclerotinia sclerotiorum 1980 UF-70]EDN95469.1 predicted protein [Sclerotinia sclerotiorum 1980 UF-70]